MADSPQPRAPPADTAHGIPIAVVGYGCRFPGDATSPEAFFNMLAEGRSAWSEVPKNRFNIDSYWHPNPERIGTTTARGEERSSPVTSVY